MRQLFALQKVLDEVEGQDPQTLEGRIAFQKRVYLVQALGLDLGYKFAWNQYGPYSPELAQDGSALDAEAPLIEDVVRGLTVRESAKKVIDKAKSLQHVPPAAGMKETAWMELLASTHYLLAAEDVAAESVDDDTSLRVAKEMIGMKPYFNEAQVQLAIGVLAQTARDT